MDWLEGSPLLTLDALGGTLRCSRGLPLCVVLLPPQSSLGSLPPCDDEGKQSKPQHSKHGHPRRGTPTTNHARKRMPIAAYPRKSCDNDGHRPTTHRPHQHPSKIDGILATLTARTHPHRRRSNTIKSHCTSRHRPDLNIIIVRDAPSKSACKKESCVKIYAENLWALPRNGAQITGPGAPSNTCTPPMAGPLQNKSPKRNGPQTQRTRGPPQKGASRRVRATDSQHA